MAKDNATQITLDEVLAKQAEAVEITAKHERFVKEATAAVKRRDTYASLAHQARVDAQNLKKQFESQLTGK